MFGQYSPYAQARRSKGQMLAEVERAHGFMPDRKAAQQIARNTLDYTDSKGTRRIRLHDTDVVTINRAGSITLDSGGWQSMTTKDRMNCGLPTGFYVYANRGWFVRTPKGTFPYVDGAKFKADGTPMNLAKMQAGNKRVKRDKALVAKFLKKAQAKGWANPAGDPWCFNPNVGREVMMDWLRSGYYTARMASLALEHCGFGPMGVSIHMDGIARNKGKPDRFVTSKLRRYIYSQLGIA